ncbi:unnamed protein product [Amoebophrya sp. A120]|nr:unnamed protein product [Amoebophrya sp. A120]|eukprot:GSA120T00002552001.1
MKAIAPSLADFTTRTKQTGLGSSLLRHRAHSAQISTGKFRGALHFSRIGFCLFRQQAHLAASPRAGVYASRTMATQLASAELPAFLAPLEGQAEAYGRAWTSPADEEAKLADFLANYDPAFRLYLMKPNATDLLVEGRDNFGTRQAELFHSSPGLGLTVHRRFFFSEVTADGTTGSAQRQTAFFLDMETYYGRQASENLPSTGKLLVIHEVVRSSAEKTNAENTSAPRISRAWVYKDENPEFVYQDRFEPGKSDYADYFPRATLDLVQKELQITDGTALQLIDVSPTVKQDL